MLTEMNRKNIELVRITKTASLLMQSGVSINSIPSIIVERCLQEQNTDGGWVGVLDTMWNVFFLKKINESQFHNQIKAGEKFLLDQKNKDGLWGRSKRDISRIPVTGLMLYLLPELGQKDILKNIEILWCTEKNSLTYKAAYILMVFRKTGHNPDNDALIPETVAWLAANQKEDGGFSPWKEHPVISDVFCTAIATLGLLQYREIVDPTIFEGAFQWLIKNQMNNGIWRFHEIEDGASWGLLTMTELLKNGVLTNG